MLQDVGSSALGWLYQTGKNQAESWRIRQFKREDQLVSFKLLSQVWGNSLIPLLSEKDKFELKNQYASDLGRYGFWPDVWRLEQLIRLEQIDFGFSIFLSNDHSYQDRPVNNNGSKRLDEKFNLASNECVSGVLEWMQKTSGHWTNDYPQFELADQYRVPAWNAFGKDEKLGFKYLLMPVYAVGIEPNNKT